jgi:hypothetical protein
MFVKGGHLLNHRRSFEAAGSHISADEVSGRLGSDAVFWGKLFPKFQMIIVSSFSQKSGPRKIKKLFSENEGITILRHAENRLSKDKA